MSLTETYKKVKSAVIALVMQDQFNETYCKFYPFASGVCVDSSGIFITAKHCVLQDPAKGKLDNEDFLILMNRPIKDQKFEVLICKPTKVVTLKDWDIAIINVHLDPNYTLPFIKMPSTWEIEEGDFVGCSGYPVTAKARTEANPNVFHGIVSRIDIKIESYGMICKDMIIDMCLHPGNSGSPIFNMKGELIGIVSKQELRETSESEQNNKKLVWTNLIHCIPYTSFYEIINKIKNENH